MSTIWVKATQSGRVGIWEKDDAHPNGEVYVSGAAIVEVAQTPNVLGKLASKWLIEVPEPKVAVLAIVVDANKSEDEADDDAPPRVSAAEARRIKLAAKAGA